MQIEYVSSRNAVPDQVASLTVRQDGDSWAFSYDYGDGSYLGRGYPTADIAEKEGISHATNEESAVLYIVKSDVGRRSPI